MRTTVDLPDELFRQAKAEAALRGRKLKDLVEDGLRLVLAEPEPAKSAPQLAPPSFHDLMRDCCGIAAEAPADYATNPKYLDGFGK
ncbi:MAG: hypothetical protein ACHQF3_07825 [Alphaproteobacteria bacterium]